MEHTVIKKDKNQQKNINLKKRKKPNCFFWVYIFFEREYWVVIRTKTGVESAQFPKTFNRHTFLKSYQTQRHKM